MIELKGKVAERFEKERDKAEKSPKTDVSENVEIVRQIVSETKGVVGVKANGAPEKLYVDVRDNLSDSILYGFTEKRTDEDIEYTRTDAFIEKACEKLEKCMYDNLMFQGRLHRKEVIETFIEDFKEYLEENKL